MLHQLLLAFVMGLYICILIFRPSTHSNHRIQFKTRLQIYDLLWIFFVNRFQGFLQTIYWNASRLAVSGDNSACLKRPTDEL